MYINEHINHNHTVKDVITHPSFKGFGQFILPTSWGSNDRDKSLHNVASLFPYHSNVTPNAIVDTLNEMIDLIGSGKISFYDFYTDQQKQISKSKESTGLYFFRGEPDAPFAVINPGGGFSYVGSAHEGFPHALVLQRLGYNAFVLQYRVGGEKVACEDLAAALSFIFANKEDLEVGTENYSVWGGSAGARITARIGSYGVAAYGGDMIPSPNTIVMAYTGHSDYTPGDPPTFAVVGERDGIANPAVMEQRIRALKKIGIHVEYHKYAGVGHGFGLGIGTSAEGWIYEAVNFWKSNMISQNNR